MTTQALRPGARTAARYEHRVKSPAGLQSLFPDSDDLPSCGSPAARRLSSPFPRLVQERYSAASSGNAVSQGPATLAAGTEPPAWQRPGSRAGVAGPGARSVQRRWQGGRARGPQGRRAQARSLLGDRWQSPHPRHPPRRVGCPRPSWLSRTALGCGGVSQASGQASLPAAAPTHPLQPEGPRAALRECRPGHGQANSPTTQGHFPEIVTSLGPPHLSHTR